MRTKLECAADILGLLVLVQTVVLLGTGEWLCYIIDCVLVALLLGVLLALREQVPPIPVSMPEDHEKIKD